MTAEQDAINLDAWRKKRREEKGRPVPPSDARPVVRLAAGEWRGRVVDEAEEALVAAGEPLYRQGGRIVRIIWDKIKVAGGGDGEVLRLSTASVEHVLECFERVARFERWDVRSDDWTPTNCPKEGGAAYLARDGKWRLLYLLGVVSSPTIRPDGSILDRPGYDAATGLVYDPAGVAFPPMPAEPTRADAEAALALLKEPIAKFPFVPGAHKSVALSGMMTAVIRRALPTAPLHAFTAPTAGSGKSMLVDVAAIMATGERAAVTTSGRDKFGDAELEKRLVSSMLAGDAVLSLDNMEGPLGGEMLCALTTQTRVKLRALGRSVNVEVPVTTSFFATSNNLTVVGDMTRRVLAGALDPGVERPELRAFDFSPTAMAKARRGELVAAVITVIRAWLASGEAASAPPLGSFEEWSRLVREPLVWLGEPDPVDVMEDVRKGDPRLVKLKAVIDAWWAEFGREPVTIADVTKRAQTHIRDGETGENQWLHKDLRDALLAVTTGGEQAQLNVEKLSWWLRKNTNRIVEDLRFVREDGYKVTRWMLVGEREVGEVYPPESKKEAEKDEDIPF